MKILGLCGSLRQGSFNRMALHAAQELMPAPMRMEIAEIKDFPPFDGDEFAKGFPPVVEAMREKVRAADGLLVACPEYNFSVSGVLKNAIDWISRGADQPFNHKPMAIFSATMGPVGGARAQYDLRKIMIFLNAYILNKPEVFIGLAQTKFDASGKLTDEPTRKILGEQMVAFKAWIERQQRASK